MPRVTTWQGKVGAQVQISVGDSDIRIEGYMVFREDDRRPGEIVIGLGRNPVREQGHKLKGGRGIRSVYSIPSVLKNQHKYTGQEHRAARTKKLEPEEPRDVGGRNQPKE